MKRVISLVLCCILTLTLTLTGCGSGGSADIKIKDSTLTGTVQSVDGDEITLTFSAGEGMPGGVPGGQQPPGKPEGDSQDSQQPPEKPDGDSQQTSEKPEGDSQQTSEKHDGDSRDGTVTVVITVTDDTEILDSGGKAVKAGDIRKGDSLTVTTDENGAVTKVVDGGSGSSQGAPDEYYAVNTYTEETSVEEADLSSTDQDESVALIQNGAAVTFDKVSFKRDNDESTGGDTASFYGVGAAVLTTDGKTVLRDCSVTTDAKGGAGVFSYGGNSTVYVSDTTIETKQDTSGGLHVSGGGKLYAWNNTVTTQGESSAAVRSDRGGGTMVIDGGSYTSNGNGSPAVYCTADISVNKAELTANGSEGVCIEGKNTLRLFNCNLTSSQTENEQNDNIWNLIVYQSMSGDAEEGEGNLTIYGGSITAKEGGLFYTTNTQSVITLSDVEFNYPAETDYFLRCTGNTNQRGWGESGANGADCTFTAYDQDMEGDIIYDSISNLDFYMVYGSSLKGAFIDDETCAGDGGTGTCNVVIDSGSVWTMTDDSTVTSISCEGKVVDEDGRTVTIKGTDGTVYVEGDSDLTLTTDKYYEKADTNGANTTGTFYDYAVDPVE